MHSRESETLILVSTGINDGGDNFSLQPGTPGYPTEVEVITTVNISAHTTVMGSVLGQEQ